ncbi:hypothetical protein BDV36DRAFT_277751 [Aspergillus pseudocaelatus]|uniref:Uncharacterized protein n=1 Tax=Aspergillus pseudocaelatus TaxID=1825620 RepID=A0ABQ6VZX6_9EURO|nr:hypothetical protein BDV36DRAFT_277751 [Aspergillus pseudocaelatus]
MGCGNGKKSGRWTPPPGDPLNAMIVHIKLSKLSFLSVANVYSVIFYFFFFLFLSALIH